ncbi:hypothetical protein ACS5PN_12190 [Roseateles sp. NT4]|uniref:hypothetical protein n=1 Tax=Roseateles sp. NT4 TaxID=3453715 RepID=UPI003EE91957
MSRYSSSSNDAKALISSRLGVIGLICGIALLLISRMYEGIQHDSALYFGQVLHRGGALNGDPFFAGGSQDSFSVYSRLLYPLYTWASPEIAHIGLLFVCILGSGLATLTLLRRMDLLPAAGLVAIATLSPLYGGLQKFSFAENFITARTLAEPLVLWSLIPLASGRLRAALALQIGAAALHPLLAVAALAVTWLLAVARDRRWLGLLALPGLALAVAATGLMPWDRLLLTYDPYWWSLVSQSNVQVVLGNWELSDWLTALTDAGVIASVARRLPKSPARQMLISLLAAAAGLTGFAFLATDGLHWVLPTQMQLWRVLWLVHLLALATAPWLVWQLWKMPGLSRLTASIVVLAMLNSHATSAYGAPILAGWVMCEWGMSRGWPLSTSLVRFSVAACVLVALGLNAVHLNLQIERLHWHPTASVPVGLAALVLSEPATGFAMLGVLMWMARASRQAFAVALSLSALLAGFAVLNWDQRHPFARAIEVRAAERPFQGLIPPEATVWWPEGLSATWGLLDRVSYYVPQQGAGMLFNRATAEIIGPRREAYRPIKTERELCEASVWLQYGSDRDLRTCLTPSAATLQTYCSKAEHPDFLVFEAPAAAPALATWNIGSQRFHLYRCSQFSPTAVQNALSPAVS